MAMRGFKLGMSGGAPAHAAGPRSASPGQVFLP